MKGWLLDTNVIAAATGPQPEPRVVRWISQQPEYSLFLSILTLGEYRKGIAHLPTGSPLGLRIHKSVASLETRFYGRILSVSDAVILRWGQISGETKRLTGHSPGVVDTLLASTAIEYDLYLVTRNVIHVSLSGAHIFNPWKDEPGNFPLL